MSWGHAVSRDLVHWEELPVALREENGIMIFTGSTVVDEHNTSGFPFWWTDPPSKCSPSTPK
jgi:sucrose-6-phosphate hydrolase SacC (GH32 family)